MVSYETGSLMRLVLENSTACTLSNAKLYPGIVGGFGRRWCLGFFEIDGQSTIVRLFCSFSQHQIQQLSPFSGGSVFSFTESLIQAQDERWRRA